MQVVYPIALLIILGLALMHFKRLVDHIAARQRTEEEVGAGSTEASEKELEF